MWLLHSILSVSELNLHPVDHCAGRQLLEGEIIRGELVDTFFLNFGGATIITGGELFEVIRYTNIYIYVASIFYITLHCKHYTFKITS